MSKNAPTLAIVAVDTAENEPPQMGGKKFISSIVSLKLRVVVPEVPLCSHQYLYGQVNTIYSFLLSYALFRHIAVQFDSRFKHLVFVNIFIQFDSRVRDCQFFFFLLSSLKH